MEYRKLPKGEEMIGTLGLGMGGIQASSKEEIKAVISKAIDNGINFFDLCAGGAKVYEPFGDAIKGRREKVYIQVHFGAIYDKNGDYGWSRNFNLIKKTFEEELKKLQTDYVDFGFLHCVDEENDLKEIKKNGILDYLKELKNKGIIHHLGFSSHTPSVANKVLDLGVMDMMMFSINPAYDLECGDEYGIGSTLERAQLFKRCEVEKVGISVMKPFLGGQLLSDDTSPFHIALTKNQCLQYVLDRPSVLVAVPGVRNMKDLDELLDFLKHEKKENDYSIIGKFTPTNALGNCVYCNHCLPCPAHIDIGLVNKYYDLSLAGDNIAHNHYFKLKINASACLKCGHCNKRCPFKVNQEKRMETIKEYFKEEK